MNSKRLPDSDPAHAHEVSLESTFDFLNTDDRDDGFPVDKLPTLDSALAWFVESGVIHNEGAELWRDRAMTEPSVAAAQLGRIHGVRSALREIADSIAEGRAARADALTTVNQALHARQVIELIPATDGVSVDHRHVGDPIDDALARLADPLVRELAGGHPERIRICDNDKCRWVFYDTSRTGRRRWCDMATCGNQAKAARHRARKRVEADAQPTSPIAPPATPSAPH
jgi:predicted RNA-binding Zn ribbon-like protein